MTSGTVALRRQQLKIMKGFQAHMRAIENLQEEDSRIHTMITDWIKTKNDMKKHCLTEIERKQLLRKPDVFQDDWQVDPEEKHILGTCHMTYSSFIRREEKTELKPPELRKLYRAEGHPFLRMPNLLKDGNKICSGCGNTVMNCHDVLYGPYCVFEVIKFCNQEVYSVDDVVVKKIFIDNYNKQLAIDMFKSNKGPLENWVFPPPCMQDNSYDYALFWYSWIIEGEWRMKKDKELEQNSDEDADY